MKVERKINIKTNYSFEAPLYKAAVSLGLAENEKTEFNSFDLNRFLIADPKNTFLVCVAGDSMKDENIYEGDLLVVNRKEEPADGKVVIAALNGEMAVKTYREIDGSVYLYSANKRFLPIEIIPFWEFEIQGIVKHVIKKM
ncbi:LexA family protein [Bacteroidota bacterium]